MENSEPLRQQLMDLSEQFAVYRVECANTANNMKEEGEAEGMRSMVGSELELPTDGFLRSTLVMARWDKSMSQAYCELESPFARFFSMREWEHGRSRCGMT